MSRGCLWGLVLSSVVALSANAQRVDVGASLGYGVAVQHQFNAYASTSFVGVAGWQHLTGFHEAGPNFSVHATLWRRPRLGVQLAGSVWRTLRSVEMEQPLLPATARERATVASVAVRLALRFGTAERRHFDVAVGPQLTHFAGLAYDNPPASFVALRSRTIFGGSAALAYLYPLSPRVMARIAVDAALYRVSLPPVQTPATSSALVQCDLVPSIGVVLRLP